MAWCPDSQRSDRVDESIESSTLREKERQTFRKVNRYPDKLDRTLLAWQIFDGVDLFHDQALCG